MSHGQQRRKPGGKLQIDLLPQEFVSTRGGLPLPLNNQRIGSRLEMPLPAQPAKGAIDLTPQLFVSPAPFEGKDKRKSQKVGQLFSHLRM